MHSCHPYQESAMTSRNIRVSDDKIQAQLLLLGEPDHMSTPEQWHHLPCVSLSLWERLEHLTAASCAVSSDAMYLAWCWILHSATGSSLLGVGWVTPWTELRLFLTIHSSVFYSPPSCRGEGLRCFLRGAGEQRRVRVPGLDCPSWLKGGWAPPHREPVAFSSSSAHNRICYICCHCPHQSPWEILSLQRLFSFKRVVNICTEECTRNLGEKNYPKIKECFQFSKKN